MDQVLLAYVFVCFSVGLVCMGIAIVVTHRIRNPITRSFLIFYLALTLLVLASLLLAFLDAAADLASPGTRAALEYLEAIVGFYGVLFTLPLFAHRVFAVNDGRRDAIVLGIVGAALVLQHVTEYGLGDPWDARGDLFENCLTTAILCYTIIVGIRRVDAPGVDTALARRFLWLFGLNTPVLVHDLFLVETTGLRFYPLAYCICSIVVVWTLFRRAGAETGGAVPTAWGLSEREAEVALLVSRGLSNKEIAAELFISLNTVKSHVRAVFDKSGCRSRFAVLSAIASGRAVSDETTPNPRQ